LEELTEEEGLIRMEMVLRFEIGRHAFLEAESLDLLMQDFVAMTPEYEPTPSEVAEQAYLEALIRSHNPDYRRAQKKALSRSPRKQHKSGREAMYDRAVSEKREMSGRILSQRLQLGSERQQSRLPRGKHGNMSSREPRVTAENLLATLPMLQMDETSPILLPCEYRPWDHMLPRHYFPDGVEENSQTPFRIVRPPRKPAPLDKSARAQHSTGSKSSTRSERAAHPPSDVMKASQASGSSTQSNNTETATSQWEAAPRTPKKPVNPPHASAAP
jgi:hypothetical protein